MLREALPRNATPPPPPGRPGQGGPPRPSPGQRPNQPPPGWTGRGPELPPAEPNAPSGPRPPEWDWSQSGGIGGAELRSEQISASELNVPRKIPSSRGWRKWLYYGTFKLINTGESPDEQMLRNLNATVAGHLRGTYSIVVLGGKGGVGKTTTTAAVGSTFASLRKDKTIAIDANPDRASNLVDRIDPSATNSYKDVLSDPNLQRYSVIRSHVGQNDPAGLDVLGNRYQSDRQPLTARTYLDTHDRLQRFYSVLISDSGTDVDHQVVPGLMSRADALIMVASTAPDGAKGAAELMDWAYEAGYHRLLQRTVVVINDVRGENGKAHRKMVDSLVEKFSRWVGQQRVFVVPFDPHIASAGVIKLNDLRPETRRRYLEITAQVASGFNASEDRR
jgi:MinD-like ATPase involved in chromosome partitioning or flagellar assembly